MTEIEQQALDIAQHAPFEARPDRFVFFSNKRNRNAAIEFCRKNPEFMTVLHTPTHQRLEALPLFGKNSLIPLDEAVDISAVASARFAKAAEGNVLVFFDKVSDHSTFFTIELPVLMQNDKVETINGAPKSLWEAYIQPSVLPRSNAVPADLLRFDML